MPRASRLTLLAGLAVLALLAGCGHPQTVGPDRTLKVGLTEYRVVPQSVRVGPGLLTIIVRNYGRLTHNLSVTLNGKSQGATAAIAPGESAELTVDLAAGHYVMASTILSDQALGTYGSLTVS
jgi:hypothetical protein